MAKIKHTKNGNVKVTMSPYQWKIFNAVSNYIRMGDINLPTVEFSNFMLDVESFNTEFYDDEEIKLNFKFEDESMSIELL